MISTVILFFVHFLYTIIFFLDEIWVDHRIPPPESQLQTPKINNYNHSFRKLFLSGIHSDISFSFEDGTSIKAHKSIVSARSDYFEAMFKIDGMIESSQKDIKIDHDSKSFRRLLEFIYTDSVEDIEECSSSEVISLLVLANQYLLDDLRGLCELQVIEMIDMDNIGQLLLLSAGYNASILKKACNSFVEENRTTLVQNNSFRQEIEANPELGLILFEASASPVRLGFNKIGDENSQVNKKRRRSNDTENDFDLILPQLGNPNNTLTTNLPDNPNQAITIAQQNADVQES